VLRNSAGTAHHSGGVRVDNKPEYYILIEWHDAADAMPPTYDQTKY
jgi:hypothetical protein